MNITCSVFIATSLDGFIARPNGAIDWLLASDPPGGNEDYGYQAFFASIDTLVMGRNTYELALTFPAWPYTGKKVVVVSHRSVPIPEKLSDEVSHLSGTPMELTQHLYKGGARHLYVDGGKTIQGFLQAGLIDEMTITRIPILLGEGIPLFGKVGQDIRLHHLQTQAYDNGFVQSKYSITKVPK